MKNAFAATEAGTSKLDEAVLKMDGITGRKSRMLYNNLGNTVGATVLIDVGAGNGASTAAFLNNNENVSACVVDDWSLHGNCNEFNGNVKSSNVTNLVASPENVDVTALPKANIVLYDSFYENGATERLIKKLSVAFADVCVLIVDDFNWSGIEQQTRDAISQITHDVIYEKVVKTDYETEAASSYWNGVGVFVLLRNGVKADAPVPAPTPAPVPVPVVEAPAPVVEPVVEAPAPVVEPVVEAPAPAAEPVVEAPAPVVEPVVEAPAPVAETPAAEAPAPAAEPVAETPA